jgi:hypothetical protein
MIQLHKMQTKAKVSVLPQPLTLLKSLIVFRNAYPINNIGKIVFYKSDAVPELHVIGANT